MEVVLNQNLTWGKNSPHILHLVQFWFSWLKFLRTFLYFFGYKFFETFFYKKDIGEKPECDVEVVYG